MRTIAVATLALLAASCGKSASPCTTCMNVQGKYLMEIDARAQESSTCDRLSIPRSEFEVEIYQQGSKLDAPNLWDKKGTLFDDDSARFDPTQVDVGNTDPVVQANATLSGGEEASRRFSGALVFSAVLDGKTCSLSTPIRGTKVTVAP